MSVWCNSPRRSWDRRGECQHMSPPMGEDGFTFKCSLTARHSGRHAIEHEDQVIEWEDWVKPRVRVPKPPVIYMPLSPVEGGREDFWRKLGETNYAIAHHEYNKDKHGKSLPWSKTRDLPDRSTWPDHMWKLTHGTKIEAHTDICTVFMVAETPVSVMIWTDERIDEPYVYGGDRQGSGMGRDYGPPVLGIGGEALILAITKKLARRDGLPFKGVWRDTFIPAWGCLS